MPKILYTVLYIPCRHSLLACRKKEISLETLLQGSCFSHADGPQCNSTILCDHSQCTLVHIRAALGPVTENVDVASTYS